MTAGRVGSALVPTAPMPAFFSTDWAHAVCARLNASEEYRQAARGWEGDVALVATADPAQPGGAPARTVWLDLHHGACRAAAGTLPEHTPAFTLSAPPAVWRDVLAGQTDPVLGIVLGKLKVDGSMTTLATNAKATRALLAEAAGVAVDD